jgi:hypothetical protein
MVGRAQQVVFQDRQWPMPEVAEVVHIMEQAEMAEPEVAEPEVEVLVRQLLVEQIQVVAGVLADIPVIDPVQPVGRVS